MKLTDREPKPSRTASLLLAGLAAAGLGLAACQRPEDQGRTLPRSAAATVTPWKPDAQPTARTAPTVRPQPPEAPKPATAEKPKSYDQQAKEITLNKWLEILSGSKQEGGQQSLVIQSKNIDSWRQQNVPIILSSRTAPEPLNVSWTLSWSNCVSTNKCGAMVYTGEMEIKNVRFVEIASVSSAMGVSEVDRANGIQYRGATGLQYLLRYHAIRYSGGTYGFFASPEEALSLFAAANKAFPEFSPWEQGGYYSAFGLDLILRNGIWEPSFFRDSVYEYNGGRNKMIIPSGWVVNEGACYGGSGRPCERIDVKTSK